MKPISSRSILQNIRIGNHKKALAEAEEACRAFPGIRIYKDLLDKCIAHCQQEDARHCTNTRREYRDGHAASSPQSLEYHLRQALDRVRKGVASPIEEMERVRCLVPEDWPKDTRLTRIIRLSEIPEAKKSEDIPSANHLIVSGDIKGGAGIAAHRIYERLNAIGAKCDILYREKSRYILQDSSGKIRDLAPTDASTDYYKGIDPILVEEMRSRINLEIHNRLDQKGAGSNTFLYHSEDTLDLSDLAPFYKSINIHWSDFLLTAPSLELLRDLDIPIVITLHDMYWITGACHYSAGCDQYRSSCRACPLTRGFSDLVSSYTNYHANVLRSLQNLSFIAPSKWLSRACRISAAGQNRDVYYVMNPQTNRNITKKHKILTSQETESQSLVVIYGALGLEEKRKGFSLFIKIAEQVTSRGLDITFKVFGSLSAAQRQQLLSLDCDVLGFLTHDELLSRFGEAHMLLLISHEDNYPNICMEAAACGLPMMCSDNSGMSEIIALSRGGIAVENKATSIVDALASVEMKHLVEYSRNLSSWYAVNHLSTKLEDAYRHILTQGAERLDYLYSYSEDLDVNASVVSPIPGNMRQYIKNQSEYAIEAVLPRQDISNNEQIALFYSPYDRDRPVQLYVEGEIHEMAPTVNSDGITASFMGLQPGSRIKFSSVDHTTEYSYRELRARSLTWAPNSMTLRSLPLGQASHTEPEIQKISIGFTLVDDSLELETYNQDRVYWILENKTYMIHVHTNRVDISVDDDYIFIFRYRVGFDIPLSRSIIRCHGDESWNDISPQLSSNRTSFIVPGSLMASCHRIEFVTSSGEGLPDGRAAIALVESHYIKVGR